MKFQKPTLKKIIVKLFSQNLLILIMLLIVIFTTIYSNACNEWKVLYLLIEMFMFLFVNKWWRDEV